MPRFTADRHVLPEPEQAGDASDSMAQAPARAPNVVLVVLDDLGFGSSSAFGGPCRMPTADRLADDGLRYSRFHVTALCSPTRQALMTGRNHHSVNMGATTEMATSVPGYTAVRPRSAATLGQTLQGNGYSTAAFGKWHQTPPSEVSPIGPFDRWPTGEGFDHFYGFMACEMNHWYPLLYQDTVPVEPDRRPEDGYHLSEDLVDRAIDWVSTQRSMTPDRPFFTYLAFGAAHAPLHVAPEWIRRYHGEFDGGWDRQREETLARQKALGVVPEGTELAPWAEGVPHWDELTDTQRALGARFMETFAGFTQHADAQLGRFVAALEDLGELDETLFVYLLGDNGASGEGGIDGTVVEHRLGHGVVDDPDEMVHHLDEIGGPHSYPIAPVGWALAMNTPYQWTKQVASHFGGTRDGLIVHWPAGIAARGGIRHQFHHVIDVLPTVLECAAIPHPIAVDGVTQQPVEGTSMRYSFDDGDAPDRHRTQYFEMCGNRGIYHEGWTAVTRHGIPWEMVPSGSRAFADDVWELYDTNVDWSQAHDLAAGEPDRLAALREHFVAEAARHRVFPLDDRVTEREIPTLAGRRDLLGDRSSITYHGRVRRLTEEAAPNVKNRSHTVVVDLETADTDTGVVVAQGGRFGGWALYCGDGAVRYVYNYFGLRRHGASAALPPGRHEVRVEFAYDGGGVGRGGAVTVLVDGVAADEVRVDATIPYYFSFDETFDVGVDLGTPVSEDYPVIDNEFTGTLHSLRIDLGDDGPRPAGPDDGLERRVMTSQ